MTDPNQEPVAATETASDRRTSERRPTNAVLRVLMDAQTLQAQAEDISAAGVYFFSSEELRVEVEVEEEGEMHLRPGRLVRVARMSADQTGYAIEFDRS